MSFSQDLYLIQHVHTQYAGMAGMTLMNEPAKLPRGQRIWGTILVTSTTLIKAYTDAKILSKPNLSCNPLLSVIFEQAVKNKAPETAGRFAMWGGTFSATNCFLAAVRKKEDSWNAIGSGFITGGVLAARMGPRVAFSSAVVGGVLLAVIEGFSKLIHLHPTRHYDFYHIYIEI